MTAPKDPDKNKNPFFKKLAEDKRVQEGAHFVWYRRVEFLSGALMLIGIVLSFFYRDIGGALVGLAFGICFFDEIKSYFLQLRDVYVAHGLFKTMMLIGTVLYFLISIPAFIIAVGVGFALMYFSGQSLKR